MWELLVTWVQTPCSLAIEEVCVSRTEPVSERGVFVVWQEKDSAVLELLARPTQTSNVSHVKLFFIVVPRQPDVVSREAIVWPTWIESSW